MRRARGAQRAAIASLPRSLKVELPPQFAVLACVCDNTVCQLLRPQLSATGQVTPYALDRQNALALSLEKHRNVLLIEGQVPPGTFDGDVLRTGRGTLSALSDALPADPRQKWITPVPYTGNDLEELGRRAETARSSWRQAFVFREEDREINQEGLRQPQVGALYAALAHWSVSNDVATIVMPTGTGKTETMLALLARVRCEKLLVLVPTAPLRQQTFEKFLSFGLLKKLEALAATAQYPVVGRMKHEIDSVQDVDCLFDACNVIISTVSAIAGCSQEVIQRIADRTTHLFIDEAHHVAAPTWSHVRRCFLGKPVLQFTATPFRRDGRRVDGKIIYNYPLLRAQQEDYFRPIRFRPVWEFDEEKADQAIAAEAVAQLTEDLDQNRDHLVMARAETIEKAKAVLTVYQELCPGYGPIIVHSRQGVREQKEAFIKLRSRQSRIVVCVDMLGEGFDFPQLKIAALHDVHKSLAVTLQFTGRFTRSQGDNIGDATMVANLAEISVEQALRKLYADDTDWNLVIEQLSEGEISRQVKKSEFLNTFAELPSEVPIQNITPKMSTVAYRVNCEYWDPEQIVAVVKDDILFAGPVISEEHKVALFVTRETEAIEWGQVHGLENLAWHLYLLHWDEERKLLFIHSSNKSSVYKPLAEAVCGDDAEIVRGEQPFRVLHGINRLILSNVGLKHALGRAIRHTMHTGADVGEVMSPAQVAARSKTNIFAHGYEGGKRATAGCSSRGRLWCRKAADDIAEWVGWCHEVGNKILDEKINVDHVLRGAIIPEPVKERPALVPLAIEWPEEFYARNEELVSVAFGRHEVPFDEVGLELTEHESTGPIRFRIFSEAAPGSVAESLEYVVHFGQKGLAYQPMQEAEAEIVVGKRRSPLSEWFRSETPRLLFEQDTFIEDDLLHRLNRSDRKPYPKDAIQVWDWSGVDITKESQKAEKRSDSIQRRVIDTLLQDGDWDIIFDDDAANEAADVVALRRSGDTLLVHLYHCKFATKRKAGARIKELYEVCGQAQKSVRWRAKMEHFLNHLRNREKNRRKSGGPSRFEKGEPRKLVEITNRSHLLIPSVQVFVVQPGVSKADISDEQLDLLSATELYLMETYQIGFGAITSA
jgi:superfamily II DNA or RNA helicase